MPYSGIFSLVYNKRIYYTIEIFPEFLQRTFKVIWKCRENKGRQSVFPACLLLYMENYGIPCRPKEVTAGVNFPSHLQSVSNHDSKNLKS